jgi:hypothetical protein
MSALDLQLFRVRAGDETQWHVHHGRRFIGSIVARDGGYEAARLVDGALLSQRFLGRDDAALWLATLAGD